jgi:hypothetical protein
VSQLKTAGDLRTFLAETLVGVRDGTIDANKANAISKVAAQINQSLSTEVMTKLKLKELGEQAAGEMLIGSAPPEPIAVSDLRGVQYVEPEVVRKPALEVVIPRLEGDKIWCEQCDLAVTVGQALGCKSKFCKAKEAA